MQSTNKGIDFNKREGQALLAFTGDKEEHAVVHFRIEKSTLVAAATDSRHAVRCEANNDGADEGEWGVVREFLELCVSGLENGSAKVPGTICRLIIKKTGIFEAHICDQESGKKMSEVKWHKNAASTQVSIDGITSTIPKAAERGSWYAVNPKEQTVLTKVSLASEKCPVTIFPPQDNLGPVIFEAKASNTVWRGIIMPVPTVGPGLAARPPEPATTTEETTNPDGTPKPLELAPSPKAKRGERPKLKADKDKKTQPADDGKPRKPRKPAARKPRAAAPATPANE